MKRKWTLAAVFIFVGIVASALLIWHAISKAKNRRDAWIKAHYIEQDEFLKIAARGTPLRLIRSQYGTAVEHEFSVLENDGEYTAICCHVYAKQAKHIDEDAYPFLLIFRNQSLIKVSEFPRWETERYLYRGTPANRPKSWDIGDPRYIRRALDAHAVTQRRILQDIQPYTGPESYSVPGIVLVPFLVASAGTMAEDQKLFEQWKNRYDGFKIGLGMSVRQVESIYGPPVKSLTDENGRIFRIYGHPDYGEKISDNVAFCCHAVAFAADDKVASIYSDGFFNAKWVAQ